MKCIFCEITQEDYILENEQAFAIFDKYPVSKGHMLIIPKRHFSSYFDCSEEELLKINALLQEAKLLLDQKYQPDGYNVGININKAAGQTIFHLHIHLIPRQNNDVEDPRGGIRNLKPQLVPYKG